MTINFLENNVLRKNLKNAYALRIVHSLFIKMIKRACLRYQDSFKYLANRNFQEK